MIDTGLEALRMSAILEGRRAPESELMELTYTCNRVQIQYANTIMLPFKS